MSDREVALCSLLERFELSSACLEIQCSDSLFLTLNTEIPSFEDAAPYFGFNQHEIVGLRSGFCTERRRTLQMLWSWRRKNGSDATYIAIVRIFLKMNDKQLAEVVLKHFKQEVPAGKYQKWYNMNEFERTKVKTNLYVEHQNIRRKFSFLVDDILKSLEERKTEVSRLKLFLATYGVPEGDSTPTLLSKIESASTLADVLLIMHMHYSSWFNIQLFKDVVNRFGSDDDQRKMKEYEKDELVPYLQRSIFEIPSKSFHNMTTDLISLVLYLPNDVIPTGRHVEIIRANLSQLLGIPDGILQFLGYDKGSTILTFAVPKALLSIAEMKNMIENYFTFNTMKNIYEFGGDLAQLLPPGIHQNISIPHDDNIVTTQCSIISSSPECIDEDETQLEDDGNCYPTIESVEDTNKDNPVSLQSDIDKSLEVDLYRQQTKPRRIPVMSESLEIPTLGRPFQLGMLYDYHNDCLLPNVNVWHGNIQKEVTKTVEEFSQFEIITDISPAEVLGVQGSLKLSVLGGLITENDVSGSAKYLYNYKSSKQQARVAIRYKYISHTERVNHKQIPNVQSSEHVATHIVTGISYAAEAIFVVDQDVANYWKYPQISKELHENAVLLCNALNNEQYDFDISQLPNVDVTYFGDIPQPQEKISTFQDIGTFCRNLKIGEDKCKVFPNQVCLYPLSELNSGVFPHLHCIISPGLVNQVENIMQHLHDIEIKCNSLIKTNVYQYFIGIQEQLSMFSILVSKYKPYFVKQLAVLLPKIRGGQEEEQELEKLCELYLTSRFNCKVLSSWIEEKECEVTFIAECIEELLKVTSMKLEFPSAIDSMKKIIAFEFKAISKIDHALVKPTACVHSKEQIHKADMKEMVQTPWYKNEVIKKNVTLKMSQFTSFAESNADDDSIKFIVTDTSEDTHMCDKGVQIVSYTNGQPDDKDFEPPSSPYQLIPSNVQHDRVNLTWSKPEYGSTSVQSYTVFYHTEDDSGQECKQQTTETNETAIVITDLVPNTSYILRVRANCPTGKGEASKNITVKTTSGDIQMMEEVPPCQTTTHTLPVLGRPFQLGMLYDYCNDCLLPDVTIWHDNALKNVVTKTSENVISQFDIVTDILPAEALGLEGSLKLSYFAGLIKESDVSGSAKYLYNYKSSKQQARVVIRYKYISHRERVNHELIPNDQYRPLYNEVGTHIVTEISYGVEAIFVIEQKVTDCEKYQQIYKELHEKAVQFCNALKQPDVDLLELPVVKESTVTYFGDIQPQEKISTFQDVAKFCKKLLHVAGEDNPNLVPKQVNLHPLSELNSGMFPHLRHHTIISPGLVSQVENIMHHLHEIEIRCNSLMKTNVYRYFIGIQKQLSKFDTITSKYKHDFLEQLGILLPNIRKGQKEERELDKLCETYRTSHFNPEILSNWTEEKECETAFIAECIEELQHVSGVNLEFTSVIDPLKTVIAFEFKTINKIDQALNTMSECLDSEKQITKDLTPWYKNQAIKKSIMRKMSQFTSFAESNADDDSIKFIVTDTSEDTHMCDKGVQIVSYTNGQPDDKDFEPPSSPYQLIPSNVQHDRVNLTWSKPEYGSTSVQSYTVFYHTEDDSGQECKQQTTETNETAIVITDLVPNTSYILRVRANCPTGKGEASKNITVKTTSGDIQHTEPPCQPGQPLTNAHMAQPTPGLPKKALLAPGQPKVVNITHNSIELTWKEPKPCDENVECYIVSCFNLDDNDDDDDIPKCKSFETKSDEKTIVIPGLIEETSYQFKVRAKYKTEVSKESKKSKVIKTLPRVLVAGPPGRPSFVNSTSNSIVLKWKKPRNNPDNIDEYKVLYCLKDDSRNLDWISQSTSGVVEQITISELIPEKSYYFKVQAVYNQVEGETSCLSEAFSTKYILPSPGKPSASHVMHNSLQLHWTEPKKNRLKSYDKVQCYRVLYRSLHDSHDNWECCFVESTKKDTTIQCLSPATKYIFKVQAGSSDHHFGEDSEESDVITTKCVIPGRPGKPESVCICDSYVQLQWTKPVENAEIVECYIVSYCSLDENPQQWKDYDDPSSSENIIVKELSPDSSYTFTVVALSKGESSERSEISDAITTLVPIPGTPGQPEVVSVTHNSISLKWTKPTQYSEYVMNYHVSYCSQEQSKEWLSLCFQGEKEAVVVFGLSPKTTYFFKVQAQSKTGFSEMSEVSTGIHTLPPVPSQPGQPKAVNISHDKIKITWAKPQLHAEYIHQYIVYTSLKNSKNQKWTAVKTESAVEVLVISGLEISTEYIFKVQAESADGTSIESETSAVIKTRSPVPSPPGKPTCKAKAHDHITLIWSKPTKYYENVKCYKISYYDDKIEKTKITDGRVEEIVIDGLDPQQGYYFKVQANSGFGNSLNSLSSDLIGTNPLRPVLKIIPHCTKLQDSPTVYHLSMTKLPTIEKQKYAKFEYGKASYAPNKVLMVVGATGSGKSTLINGMINYLLGVEWDDEFRLKLIHDEVESQTKSVTKLISAYTFHKHDDFPLPYSLTIVDTPGFGDTEGIEKDQKITRQIRQFFTEHIDHLDGIGFVAQSGQARLTKTQIYIFNSIFSIFGKDMKDSIFTMVTFADSANPPVIGAIKEAEIPCTEHFQFNNSALYTDERNEFAKMFWDIGAKSFNEFFDKFGKAQSVSLTLTTEVLHQREQLEANIVGLQKLIHAGMLMIDSLKQQQQILNQNKAKIEESENFEFEVEEVEMVKVACKSGLYVSNCFICNMTCHQDCTIPDDGKKYRCFVMKPYNEKKKAKCTICPGECAWDKHKNAPYWFACVKTMKTKCYEEIKKKYYTAVDGKTEVESVIANMETNIILHFQMMLQNIQKVHHSVKRLDEIALKHNPLSDLGYINLLIESEKQDGKPGFEKRVHYYRELRKQAVLISKTQQLPQQLSPEEEKEWLKEFLSMNTNDSDELLDSLPHVKF